MEACCPYFDPDFENLNERIYGPRFSVDNESCDTCTVVEVDSLDKQGLLLEVLQVLTDMDLYICKSYISSDAGWFMDVFHVKDQLGNKVANELVAGYIQQAIDVRRGIQNSGIVNENTGKTEISSEHTAIEMIGINRPGLFSEISAVLAEERCNIVEAHAWSHNTCLACVAYVSDQSTSTFIDDPNRLATIEDHLSTVLQPATMPDNDHKGVNTCFHGCNSSMSRTERRLHQLMLANRDFEVPSRLSSSSFSSMGMHHDNAEERRMVVSIDRCSEKGYSIVNVRCMDRPKLMFDIVCTLADMQYVIFHASITSHGPFAYQEYYIRHRNGYMLNTTKERQQVSKCLEAAIERRVCEGVRLELCAQNSVGLLPYVTRILREYGLTVARADIAAQGDKMKNVFYVQDISGKEVDMGMLEPMMRELEPLAFQVKNEPLVPQRLNTMERESFSFSSLLRSQSSSSSSSSSSEGDEDRKSSRAAHPGSPSNAHQSSDESTTSDGVLVEIPNNPDQDARGVQGDPDGGILVNIDGSTQEGREDLFVDAPEELGSARSVGLDESVAMIEYGEGSGESESSVSRSILRDNELELIRLRDRLDETLAQCKKYKEEREVFGREVLSLRCQLGEMFNQHTSTRASNEKSDGNLRQTGRGGGEEDVFMSPTPLHSMVTECSKNLSHLKSILDDQLNSNDTMKVLNAVLHTKEQQVEDLNLKLAESNLCHDVVISYIGSVREIWSNSLKESSDEVINRLLASLEVVTGRESPFSDDYVGDGILLVEKKTFSLIEKHTQLVSDIHQLRQFLAETRPELLTLEENDFSCIYSVARDELLESKRKEASALEKISVLEDENRKMAEEINKMKERLEVANAEANITKMELEQAENKLATAREKLSIAVTKGKSLVQHRDALKQSLADKTNEFEKCILELQQKSSEVEALEASAKEQNRLLTEKTIELENCLLELQQKSSGLEDSEARAKDLKQRLDEKTNELENCLLELQHTSSALEASEGSTNELKQLLDEKTNDLENCLLELQQKSGVLEASETSMQEVKHLLAEKTSELENYLLELQQKSGALEASEDSTKELKQLLSEKTGELENCLLELQQKSGALEASEDSTKELKQLLSEKTNELENCLLELQQKSTASESAETSSLELYQSFAEKTSELEKCLLELQQKSEALENTETSAQEMKQSLSDRTDELDKCVLELRQKSDALVNTEANYNDLNQLLAEKNGELETCLLELQHKSVSLEASEANAEELRQTLAKKTNEVDSCLQKLQEIHVSESTVEELKMSLAEKVNELDKCQIELQHKSDTVQTYKITTNELKETHNLVNTLQESLTAKINVINEIEEIMQQTNSKEDLLTMEVTDRVKWFVNHKHISDALMSERNNVKDTMSSIDVPETISSAELDSQIGWLVKSLRQAKEDLVKLQEDITGAHNLVASHELELSEAHKEIERMAAVILEVKHEKDNVQGAHDDLKHKFEKIAENLALISSEKDELMKDLAPLSASSLDGNQTFDAELLIENGITVIGERIKTSLTQREKFGDMQTLLYIKCQEQMLCENILEEEIISRSEITNISNELKRASEEIVMLRNEKEAMQKELERVEERSSLIREKLSMAVKKGKGLVQEREGFKQSLDQKNSEIERLKQELQHQESAVVEYKEQIKNLSAYSEHVKKLESDIVSLKDMREQTETLLLESSKMLQTLVESIEDIALPTDKTFEKPVEKLCWISEHIHELEAAKTHTSQELEELKSEATLHACRLADAVATIDSLKDELSLVEKHIFNITREKNEAQLVQLNIEQELEKLKEVNFMQASKLEDAYATIRSIEDQLGKMNTEEELEELRGESSMLSSKLEDAYATIKSLEEALKQASNSISNLEAEKDEIESKSQHQIDALTVKLADCMKELAGARSSLENQSGKFVSHLGDLKMLIKDDGLLFLMTEDFRKKIEGLRQMVTLLQDLNDQFIAKGLHIDTSFEQVSDFAKFSSLQEFEDFIDDETFTQKVITEDLDDASSLDKIVEGFHDQAKLLSNRFQGLSRYTDDHVAAVLQALQETKYEFMFVLELSDSLKQTVNKLQSQNQTQEIKMSSLDKEMAGLFSACQGATQELQIELSDLLEFYPEHDGISSKLDLKSIESIGSMQEDADHSQYAKAAKSLSLAAKKIKVQAQQLTGTNRILATSVNDLRNQLKQANLAAETAIQDRKLSQDRLSKLERDLEELQNICSDMKVKIEDDQVKKDMLRDKEAEISSLQNALTAKDKGTDKILVSEGQIEAVIDKVNKMVIPSNESQIREVDFSSPVDKLFYILDNFTELQHRVESLTYEKEDLQLILESHVREIDHQKKAAETIGTNFQDLETKKLDLIELTVGLEKIVQRFGGNNLSEDQRPTSAIGFLPVLERLMITSYNELEISKSRMQELVAKLQAEEKVVDELSTKNELLEDSIHARIAHHDIVKERTVYDASSTTMGSEISEVEDVVPLVKNSVSAPAAHARTMRKGSTDHLALNIDLDSDPLFSSLETKDKGHVLKSLNASGLIPKQGKMVADRVDGIWVSGGRALMNRPRARLGLMAYWIFLHLWLLGTIL